MNCDVCKNSISDDSGRTVAGMEISLLGAHPAREEIERIYGKNEFRICYLCLLKALGVKKKTTAKRHA